MSLITRCPACATMFKVVPDQLRVSDGWVRCGQCNEVFDANDNLQPGATDELSQAIADKGDRPVQPAPPVQTVDAIQAAAGVEAIEASEAAIADPFLEVNPHALHIETQEIGVSLDQMSARWESPDPRDAPLHEEKNDRLRAIEDDDPPHSFMRAAGASSRWDRPSMRIALWVLGLFLSAALILQIAVRERDRIAATEPATKDFLDPLCALLGCRVLPLRQIESVVIDSSSFAKVRSDVYRLSFALKSTAPIAVATPSVELTLTDIQDQAVVRRVFVAADFVGGKQMLMEPGTEVLVSLPVAVKLPGNGEKISGYRLLSFYP